ncbi:hypothetical protein FBY53_1436 [Zymomonas mobilis]|nr:hypothetical protein FBY53_1436 [Zymomonas mobilis]
MMSVIGNQNFNILSVVFSDFLKVAIICMINKVGLVNDIPISNFMGFLIYAHWLYACVISR